MRWLKGLGIQAAALVAVLALPGLALAQNCNLTNPPCSGACSNAPCGGSVLVNTATFNVCNGFAAGPVGNSWDLSATQFQNTCHGGPQIPFGGPGCGAQAGILAPFRFWALNNYKTANSGCQDLAANGGVGNAAFDLSGFTTTPPPGQWFLYNTDWVQAKTDGCSLLVGSPPVVVEVSAPWPAGFPAAGQGEGTVNHNSWYAIGSVPGSASYDLDGIVGPANASCPGNRSIPAAPVGGVTFGGRTPGNGTGLCRGDATATKVGTSNANASFFDITVNFETPSPAWYTEAGPSGAPALIAGYQILYVANTEPTSSNFFTGGWIPVLDTANPTLPRAPVPVGTASTTVTLPKGAAGDRYWFATRLVYTDSSLNTGATVEVASDVSQHCGPVTFDGGVITAVEFADVSATRKAGGIEVTWRTLYEDDVLGFRVLRASGPSGADAEALPELVTAAGMASTYVTTDTAATGAETWYYVQELTSNGPGDRSEAVRVDAQASGSSQAPGVSGGRSRSRSRR